MKKVRLSLISCGMLCLLALFPTWAQVAQPTPAPPKQTAPVSDPYGRNTPHGTLLGFLRAAQTGQWGRAAYYLQLPSTKRESQEKILGPQLKEILDQHSTYLLGGGSDQPEGDLSDGLPPDQEMVGTIEGPEGSLNLLLVRVTQEDTEPIWLFSAETLANLKEFQRSSTLFWVEEKLPAALAEKQFLGVALWKWLANFLSFPVLFAGLWLLLFVAALLMRLIGRKEWKRLPRRAFGPLACLLVLVLHWWMIRPVGLPILFRYYQNRAMVLCLIAVFLWLAMHCMDWVGNLMVRRTLDQHRTFALSTFGLIRGVSKVLLIIIASLLALWVLGFNLGTALAGVGIGGIAIALGAQKTLENLIGGVSMLTDRVLQVGDQCKIGDQIGAVEEISLRSTKIRTREGSLLAVPNGVMATINLENLSNRKRYLFNPAISLRYETNAEKVLQGVETIQGVLNEHSGVDPADLRVCFKDFGAFSLDVEVFAYILTNDYAKYVEIRQQLLLQILCALESAGIGFAFPPQIFYLTRNSGA